MATNVGPATPPAEEAIAWEFSAALMMYVAPDSREYVIDTGDSSDNFFYNWSELTIAPWDWVRFGMVTQRTRLYESDREIQRGLLLGCSYRRLTLTGYLMDPDESRPTFIFGLLGHEDLHSPSRLVLQRHETVHEHYHTRTSAFSVTHSTRRRREPARA